MTTSTIHFYRDLPAISSFADVTEGHLHADLPDDWWIVVADVAGSTQAIASGAYKDVNTVGVACIAAVVNVDRTIDIPFIFGGDGATFAIPDSLRERVMAALRAAQQLSQQSFNLRLRVGLVQIGELAAQGFAVRMGKVRLSPHVTQPVLSGRGWEEAERRVKTLDAPGADAPGAAAPGVLHTFADDGPADGNFEGFECRWKGVPHFNGHKLALLVAANSGDLQTDFDTYERVMAKIGAIYGDESAYHPLRAEKLRLAFSARLLSHEWRVRSSHLSPLRRIVYCKHMLWQNIAGAMLFLLKRDTEAVRWTRYRGELVDNSDFRKFDGMLRMVIDGNDGQAARLEQFLEDEYRANRLVYGMHKSREALITCLVHSYNGEHQHFVDGSDGGYALAAKALKQRLASRVSTKQAA